MNNTSASKEGKIFETIVFDKLINTDLFEKLTNKPNGKNIFINIDSRTAEFKKKRRTATTQFKQKMGKFHRMNASASLKGDYLIDIDGVSEVFDAKNYSNPNDSFKFPNLSETTINNFIKGSDSNIKYPVFYLLKTCNNPIYNFLFPEDNKDESTKELERVTNIIKNEASQIKKEYDKIKSQTNKIKNEVKEIKLRKKELDNDYSKLNIEDIEYNEKVKLYKEELEKIKEKSAKNKEELEKNKKYAEENRKKYYSNIEKKIENYRKIAEKAKDIISIEFNKRKEICEINANQFISIFRMVELGFAWEAFNIKPKRNLIIKDGNKIQYKYVSFDEITGNVKVELYLDEQGYLYILFVQKNKVLFIISRRTDGVSNCSFINRDYVKLVGEVNASDYDL